MRSDAPEGRSAMNAQHRNRASTTAPRLAAAVAALVLSTSVATAAAPAVSVDLELVIAVDISPSMDAEEQAVQRAGYVEAIRHPDFIEAVASGAYRRIALTYVEWAGSDWQATVIPWRLIDSPASARAFADQLSAEPISSFYGTSISSALTYGAALFADNGFDGKSQTIDISGDGPNNSGGPVAAARDAVIDSGIVVNGLPVMIRPSPIFPAMDRYYADCVIGGPGAFVLPVRNVEEFDEAIRRKLVLEVAARTQPARLIPVEAPAPVDCLIGERMRRLFSDKYLPGLEY
jgi:Protein of unknown function (DUF1194)